MSSTLKLSIFSIVGILVFCIVGIFIPASFTAFGSVFDTMLYCFFYFCDFKY